MPFRLLLQAIVEAAAASFAAATAGGGWNNDAVFQGAPHSALIAPFISPSGSQILTISGAADDLIKVIRAAAIDDKQLMAAVSSEQMVEFFLYATEINALVAAERTRRSGRLTRVITANDLSGINLLGIASTQASDLSLCEHR